MEEAREFIELNKGQTVKYRFVTYTDTQVYEGVLQDNIQFLPLIVIGGTAVKLDEVIR